MVVVQASRKTISVSEGNVMSSNKGPQNVMNVSVKAQDSLYYICLNVKRRLERLPQLLPYLNLAYASSELLSERQSLLLSQKQQQQLLEKQQEQSPKLNGQGHRSISSAVRDSHDGFMSSTNSAVRSSSISNISIKDEISMDGITYTNSSSNNSGTSTNMEDTMLTFSMGILPISMDCDPVTQLSQLFQQGSPLCILFNAVKPQYKVPIVSSDDLKICKKSIYDFILGCKKHFAFNDEELFTISDVFANSTTQLMKVLSVVTTLMDSAPEIFPSSERVQLHIDKELDSYNTTKDTKHHTKKDDEYIKIIKEFVATERKYVHDLEILDKYKQQLLDYNLITSEELYMLFPNLSEAIDFQRRFLISLEINALVEPPKQRIGALFMHSKYFFKIYEPWSIGQNAAIDFLTSTLAKIQSSNFIITNKLELQSFLYKPVQRLCRYPLLLKELLSANEAVNGADSSTTDNNAKELEIALDISKKIAGSINENQRRTENHQIVKKLYGRVINWKGYRIAKFGELLYYDKVFISTNNSNEPEREFDVYLFEKIIILFSEIVPRKSSSLMLKKKNTSASTSSLTLNSTSNNNKTGSHSGSTASLISASEPKLDLRGRIMIMNLKQINPLNTHSLNITWESVKEQGTFLLKFKNEETRDNWSSCLQSLVRNVKSESYKSTISEHSYSSGASTKSPTVNLHDSITSISSPVANHISDLLPRQISQQKKRVSNFENLNRVMSETYKNSIPDNCILIRISFNSDFYTILIELNSDFIQLLDTVKKKLNPFGTITKIKYRDEDGDRVMLASEDDWLVAKDMLRDGNERILNITAYK
ncbi:hypothetical protein KAFR_0K00480 [Kazachstania africana CBS 2517]|uniref:DH domain-containing protein n=1 Tax=Kazachstania africana (strain ATCC 22294 / BCRC 22015 / CBS 2517 / CECT 1963 / NBRC 1671 / NRRL Y-8276) TaxID=1071382 RepID=H2B1A3_KAZAF|nr:hypothetical protein KAFR_0K00480 [Kazachstania africana CBS 2517]CCF60403.1 hypothetical protein KAFR_0K00480 [Kazachstania africana CBS 2517]